MLNFLVQKALERAKDNQQGKKPIFSISYSALINSNIKNKQMSKSNTVVSRMPQLGPQPHNIFQKWKRKTSQKIKCSYFDDKFSPQKKNADKNSLRHKKKIPLKQYIAQRKGSQTLLNVQSKSFVENTFELKHSSQKAHIKLRQSPSRFHQSPSKSRQNPFKSRQNPSKSIYLLYKDRKKNTSFNSQNSMIHQRCLIIEHSQQKSKVFKKSQQKRAKSSQNNIGFFNTIQYKSVPHNQIRYYKADEIQLFRKNLNRNHTIDKNQEKQISHRTLTGERIRGRNFYTQKRQRKCLQFTINHQDNPQFQKIKTIQNRSQAYRPWSPVKVNPIIGLINDDQLMFEQSSKFDIFSKIQVLSTNR